MEVIFAVAVPPFIDRAGESEANIFRSLPIFAVSKPTTLEALEVAIWPGADWRLSVVRPEEAIDQRVWVE